MKKKKVNIINEEISFGDRLETQIKMKYLIEKMKLIKKNGGNEAEEEATMMMICELVPKATKMPFILFLIHTAINIGLLFITPIPMMGVSEFYLWSGSVALSLLYGVPILLVKGVASLALSLAKITESK